MDAVQVEPGDVDDAPVGLRERRRRETQRDVSDAALALFERKGVAATTVDEIARAAGISARTFFRYYATKEEAAFAPEDDNSVAVHRETLAAIRGGAPVAAALETGWLRLLEAFDAHPETHARALRLRRLVHAEPALLAVALRNEAASADALTDAAVDAAKADADVLTARALITAVSCTVRLAFDEWARRAELGQQASARQIYLELRRGLATYAGQVADGV
ncbi:TetR family transcriptional regulator [Microbacterium sp. zg.Y625]|uniref:TetR family transcriptional regulator n=1 Tax=Microbacterium jiangjiandongii TaxID=3049071 RepID=UPI00214B112A|nr:MULTISPECIES: TetR family transcriptional regulator [unclassified Microbacterium]MCR2792367.1 TetR family transcriptional regulator [Microbacterium sp. zg.Y625]WIM26365.1 TetR family transcriptional regulator [Microbacterium sp. zg-Y625]